MTITAKVIAHSRPYWADDDEDSYDIMTLALLYPRIVHAELMTHRVFSRNASSSRAIPVAMTIQRVLDDPYKPSTWALNQRGMQAGDALAGRDAALADEVWESAMRHAVAHAHQLKELGVHKQWVNRLLEPWSHIAVVVTSTEWANFHSLRDHSAAQPEIDSLSKAMKEAVRFSVPSILGPGEWHLPYALTGPDLSTNDRIDSSVAGCARVSYMRHDSQERTIQGDIERAAQLLESRHMSPFEHQATPMTITENWPRGATHRDRWGNYWSGNFRCWAQHRKFLANSMTV